MSDTELRRDLLLRMQVALLGMVTPRLRAVTVGWSQATIEGRFYFDGPVSEADEEIVSEVETEVIASFPGKEVAFGAVRLDVPARPLPLQAWVFHRRER